MQPLRALSFQLLPDVPFQPPRNTQRIERGRPAIRNQAMPGDGGRLIRRQEQHDLRHLLRLRRISARIEKFLSPDFCRIALQHFELSSP